LTDVGARDPIFAGFDRRVPVVQWHGDTFTIPPGGVQLARSALCENQALRVNGTVGLQFHLEIGRAKMAEWMREYLAEAEPNGLDPAAILQTFADREALYAATCRKLIRNFCSAVAPGPRVCDGGD